MSDYTTDCTHDVFNTTVLPLRVFSDGDKVDGIVWRLETHNGLARPHVGIQVKRPEDRRTER